MTTLFDEYNAAIGSLVAARHEYEAACTEQGAASSAAERAQEQVSRAVEHRDEVRERYDAVSVRPTSRTDAPQR